MPITNSVRYLVLSFGIASVVLACGSDDSDSDANNSNNAEPACAAALGLFADDGCETVNEGVVEWRPQYPLWSDGVSKQRFTWIPDGETIDTSDPDVWVFPVGTKLWKTFQTADGQRLETRIIEKTADLKGEDGWTFETYAWNEAGDDVTLVEDGQQDVLGTQHDIPPTDDCAECHSGGENQRDANLGQDELLDLALGFGAIQLNHADTPTNLESLLADGLLSDEISTEDALIPGDETAKAALGYLHGNCGSCHGGGAPNKDVVMFIPVGTSTVEDTPTYQTNIDQMTEPGERAEGLEDMPAVRIVPGDAENSALVWRMQQRRDGNEEDDAPMPPLATDIVDDDAVSAVSAWVNSL